eukprot:2037939-Pyramimonas_sp.AAC.1
MLSSPSKSPTDEARSESSPKPSLSAVDTASSPSKRSPNMPCRKAVRFSFAASARADASNSMAEVDRGGAGRHPSGRGRGATSCLEKSCSPLPRMPSTSPQWVFQGTACTSMKLARYGRHEAEHRPKSMCDPHCPASQVTAASHCRMRPPTRLTKPRCCNTDAPMLKSPRMNHGSWSAVTSAPRRAHRRKLSCAQPMEEKA